jgi:hypothetical protein
MYLTNCRSYYDVDGQQHARTAEFLVLLQSKARPLGADNFRAVIRKVALRQCGHWMMGSARIAGERVVLSGSYGADGLPVNVSEAVYAKGVDVPRELYDAWSKGGGWNSCGSEAPAFRAWALEHKRELRGTKNA